VGNQPTRIRNKLETCSFVYTYTFIEKIGRENIMKLINVRKKVKLSL
jgi:hypothetical protein